MSVEVIPPFRAIPGRSGELVGFNYALPVDPLDERLPAAIDALWARYRALREPLRIECLVIAEAKNREDRPSQCRGRENDDREIRCRRVAPCRRQTHKSDQGEDSGAHGAQVIRSIATV